jgi:Uma2 family endonuclease
MNQQCPRRSNGWRRNSLGRAPCGDLSIVPRVLAACTRPRADTNDGRLQCVRQSVASVRHGMSHLDGRTGRARSAAMEPARRRATYEDVLNAPEHVVAEIIDGELYTSPRPASPHARAGSAIGSDLFGAFDRPPGDPAGLGGWWIFDEPELHLGSDVIVPDLAGWRREHMPNIPKAPYLTQAPDWVCEIVSPSTEALDRGHKMRIYAREHMAHLWIVDPLAETVEVYRLETGRWVVVSTYAGNDRVRAEPFDAIEVDLRRWWLEP